MVTGSRKAPHPPGFIVTSDIGGGKTSFLMRVISFLAEKNIRHTGFFAEGAWEKGVRSGFTLTLVPEMERIPLCDRSTGEWIPYGRFRYNPDALKKGSDAVRRALPGEIIIMDEIGLQELHGCVWADTLTEAVTMKNPLILSVQCRNLNDVISKWALADAALFDGTLRSWEVLLTEITDLLAFPTRPAI